MSLTKITYRNTNAVTKIVQYGDAKYRHCKSSYGRGSRDDRPRKMFTATCGDCGNECQIPFEPKNDRPVYCNECYPNHKQN